MFCLSKFRIQTIHSPSNCAQICRLLRTMHENQQLSNTSHTQIIVQVCSLNCHNSCTFGEQACTFSNTGARLNPKYSFLQSQIEAFLHFEGCKDYRCRFALWGVNNAGANLRWLQILWVESCFGGARLRPKGCWYCEIFGVQTCTFTCNSLIVCCYSLF